MEPAHGGGGEDFPWPTPGGARGLCRATRLIVSRLSDHRPALKSFSYQAAGGGGAAYCRAGTGVPSQKRRRRRRRCRRKTMSPVPADRPTARRCPANSFPTSPCPRDNKTQRCIHTAHKSYWNHRSADQKTCAYHVTLTSLRTSPRTWR